MVSHWCLGIIFELFDHRLRHWHNTKGQRFVLAGMSGWFYFPWLVVRYRCGVPRVVGGGRGSWYVTDAVPRVLSVVVVARGTFSMRSSRVVGGGRGSWYVIDAVPRVLSVVVVARGTLSMRSSRVVGGGCGSWYVNDAVPHALSVVVVARGTLSMRCLACCRWWTCWFLHTLKSGYYYL